MTTVTVINRPVQVSINSLTREIRVQPQKVEVTVKPLGPQGIPGKAEDPGDLAAIFNSA